MSEDEQMRVVSMLLDRVLGKGMWEVKKPDSMLSFVVKYVPDGYDFEMTTSFHGWHDIHELVFGSNSRFGLMQAVSGLYDGVGWLVAGELRETNPVFHAHLMKCFREKMVYADSFEELALKLEVV